MGLCFIHLIFDMFIPKHLAPHKKQRGGPYRPGTKPQLKK